MRGPSITPLYIDSDNALGSPRGDVDDGFAVAALFASGVPIAGLASVFGNTTELLAHANHKALASLCGYEGPLLHGAEAAQQATRAVPGPATPSEASRFLLGLREPVRVLALGPLTNLAAALDAGLNASSRWTEVVAVAGNSSSHGRWPPVWPFEFNVTKDRHAARKVFASGVRLTLVPLDVARRLTVASSDIEEIPGPLGAHLRAGSARWLKRAARLKRARSFPVWDLVAALYALDARLFETRAIAATLHANGWIEFGSGEIMIQCVHHFERNRLWRYFLDLAANC